MKKITKFVFKFVVISVLANLIFVCQVEAQAKKSNVADQKDNGSGVLSYLVTDTVNVLYGTKPMKYITGAVSSVSGDDISNVSGSNRFNSLSGRMTGLSVLLSDGVPGFENPTLQVRGSHTFGSNNTPVVLIDGRVADPSMLDPYDIESVSVLKDASAAIMYGLRSTDGIILITTKKGRTGKINVNFNSETSFSQPTRMPKYLDSYNYAVLHNEAQLNDNPAAVPSYTAAQLSSYKFGGDPYKYPNVNWINTFLKDHTIQTRNSLNISGGGRTARYYVSASYLRDNGLFNVDKSANTYNTNSAINTVNTHGNIEISVSKNLTLTTDIKLLRDVRNAPGAYSNTYDQSIFQTLFSTPSNANPIKNPDGSIAGTVNYQNNPYGLLNLRGYSVFEHTSITIASELVYDLGSVLKGLKLKGNFGYNNINEFYTNRTKTFPTFQRDTLTGVYTQRGLVSAIVPAGAYVPDGIFRKFDHSVSLNYSGQFGKHNIDVLMMYQREQIEDAMIANLAKNFQGPKGDISYRFNNKYLVDFSFAYQGSEQFPKNDRYGFFPAVSAGWIATNEKFLQDSKIISFLKFRGSYGQTGNMPGTYFGYLGSYGTGTGAYFGTALTLNTGYVMNRIPNQVAWETSLKKNGGVDLTLFKNRISASFDYFDEKNENITVSNAVTSMFGATVSTPVGSFSNKGYEFQVGWKDKIRDFEYYVNLNYTATKNNIDYQNEATKNFPWMYTTGHPLGTRFGYVFDRFFTEDDFVTGVLKTGIPTQTVLGVTKPGDLKYKDLNNDGVIDPNDQTQIGYAKIPEINYGLNAGFKYNGFDLSVLFQGTGNSTTYNSGYTYWDFYGSQLGNVMEHHLNRWVPGSGQNAGYPRLTLINTNNYVSSSYWVQDNSYIRFKYLEFGYTLPAKISRKVGMSKLRLFVNGNNLYVWSKVKTKDPEIQDNGLAYPLQRTFSAGFNLNF